MRNRIVAVACGIILAVVALPAVPAAAAPPTTCANLYEADGPQPGGPDVLARACISWSDSPDGNSWTLYEHRIWNPPGGVNYTLNVFMFRNTGAKAGGAVLESGETLFKQPNSVGPYTAKFAVLVQGYSATPYCIYLIPRDYNIEHHNC
jgi:hypothetical protein